MVQVDVFWTYGLAAGFAAAASRQIRHAPETRGRGLLGSGYATTSLLFHSLLFVPSGFCLLWAFPSWETMHVGDRDLPAWLVTAFGVTNITQALLGFAFTAWLARRGRTYAAFTQFLIGHFLLFFILIHGWDGTGYQRFFSPTRADFLAWRPSNVLMWLTSDVALTLYAFGLFIVPCIFYFMARWIGEGYALADAPHATREAAPGFVHRILLIAWGIFGLALTSALTTSLLIRALGWGPGLLLAAVIIGGAVLRRGGAAHRLYVQLYQPGPGE